MRTHMDKIYLIILLFVLTGCAANMQQTSLYFGQAKPQGGFVTAAEWNSFVQQYISRRFAAGFSVIKVDGKWQDTQTHQLISEPTYLVLILHKRSKQLSAAIDSLRSQYKTLFNQQSVLRTDQQVKANF